MEHALDGVNVVEFDSHHGAAYAAMLLAEHGARVIKVEPPGGSRLRGAPHFHALNRSKRAVALKLGTGADQGALGRLLGWADLVISGFTPGQLRKFSLDYETIHWLNPQAISVEMPPLGSRGPWADLAAGDALVCALGGIYGSQWSVSGDPVAIKLPMASYSAGLLAALSSVAALLAREDHGGGQRVEVSLLAGALSLQTGSVIRHPAMSSVYQGSANDPLGPIPCYRLFRARDGGYLFVACGNATFWNKLALAVERPELVSDPRFEGAPWGIAAEHRQTLKDLLQERFDGKDRDDWLSILRAHDVPCAAVGTRHEFIDHPQVRHLGMRRELSDPTLGPTVQSGIPLRLSATPAEITGPACAVPGSAFAAEVEALLARPSRARAAAMGRRKPGEPALGAGNGGPLSGIVVLDFASYIAGSYGPMILAQLGAQVIKIESRQGDSFRAFGFGFFGWNQGKQSLAIDPSRPEGREIIQGLARRADVMVENLRPGRMRRFGLDYETLARLNPGLVYMTINGFGSDGPKHDQPGFDPLLQASSGLMAAAGGHDNAPMYLTCAVCDYGAAMLSALGCTLALWARRRTGRGQLCSTSLLQSAMAMQTGEFIFYRGRPEMEDGHPEARGRSALSRAYRCAADQWLFLDIAEPKHWERLSAALGLEGGLPYEGAAGEQAQGALAQRLERAFSPRQRDPLMQELLAAGVPVAPVNRIADLFLDPQLAACELLVELEHRESGKFGQTGVLTQFSATPGSIQRPAPALGEHGPQILEKFLGYGPDRIAQLRQDQVVV